jgi:hypothetical protein
VSGSWRLPLDDVVRLLEDAGLEVSPGATPPGRDVRAVEARSERYVEVVVDAGGRVRVTTSRLTDDAAREPVVVHGHQFQRVSSHEERTTVTGVVESLHELRGLLRSLRIGNGY